MEVTRSNEKTDEEYKVARLTGFSKNTCGSANSLSYSPSPKKLSHDGVKVESGREVDVGGIEESPILVNKELEKTANESLMFINGPAGV